MSAGHDIFAEQNIDDIQRQVERVLADDGIAVCI